MQPPSAVLDQLGVVQDAFERTAAVRHDKVETAKALEAAAVADKKVANVLADAEAALEKELKKLVVLEQSAYGPGHGAVGIVVEPGAQSSR